MIVATVCVSEDAGFEDRDTQSQLQMENSTEAEALEVLLLQKMAGDSMQTVFSKRPIGQSLRPRTGRRHWQTTGGKMFVCL